MRGEWKGMRGEWREMRGEGDRGKIGTVALMETEADRGGGGRRRGGKSDKAD